MLTARLARFPLTSLPSPVEELARFREALGKCPKLLIKRDDKIGLATGGNKTRRLEFIVADALGKGADTLATFGGAQSNHCMQTAAAAARTGLQCVLILSGEQPQQWTGNFLLDKILGANIYWAGGRDRMTVLHEILEAHQNIYSNPYIIPNFGSTPIGAAADVMAIEELQEQLDNQGQMVDRIIFASSSGGTQAGFLVGTKALGLKVRIEGIAVEPIGDLLERIKWLTEETCKLLGLNLSFSDSEYILHEVYGYPGYAVVTDAERNSIKLLSRTEAIITDPVYSGRALVGLIDMVNKNLFDPEETVLFWHTGGIGGLFANNFEFTNKF